MHRDGDSRREQTGPETRNVRNEAVVHGHIARALARDYIDLYHVNMETGEFIEYRTDRENGELAEIRRGADFFERCRLEAKQYIHPDDRKAFTGTMDRALLAEKLGGGGTFELTCRRIENGEPLFTKIDFSRMADDRRFIVIAVSDTDEIMKRRLAEQRIREERIVYARLHALTGNFICVYVVDPETDSYREFSATDDYVNKFAQAKDGTDFFNTAREAARVYNHPDDLDRFLAAVTRENILAETKQGGVFTLVYRLMKDGAPVHVQMCASMVEEEEGLRLIVGLNDIDARFRQEEMERENAREKEIYNQITASLAEQYDTLYYIDIDTGSYKEISSTDDYKKLNVPATGNDFFAESRRSIRKYVHPEDQDKVLRIHYKEAMLANLKKGDSFSIAYRLVVDGKVRHIRHTELMARDRKHIIVCVRNIDAEVDAQRALMEDQKKSVTYTQIAERLAAHFDLIYYIDCKNSHYAELSAKRKSGELRVQEEGKDFFATARKNLDRLVYSEDRERIRLFLDRDHLISGLENRRQLTEDYRMVIEGKKTQYTRMSVTYSSDHSHFIICVENRDNDVRREREHLAALSMANEMARRDELTHTKNKTAYQEAEKELQEQIRKGSEPFGIVICDINGLKVINDTEGHKAGDEYIKAACILVCRTFQHSPVFRIGGDEFVVILRGSDYEKRERLLDGLKKRVEENIRVGEGPVVASGMAEYRPGDDLSAEDVFNRADSLMYGDKTHLKELKLLRESHSLKEKANVRILPDERRNKLDTLFKAFEVVSEGTYVYLCDMKYDFSHWSKNAVDTFGLPSEYMYGAGDIWENHIHPDDRLAYRQGIDDIFAGNTAGHDMQYRAQRPTGEYDVCTCRGMVIRDLAGEPDYFAGTIRNHGIQGHIDTLTGLRNQYGFFEDLEGWIKRNTGISVLLFGISRFFEINEIYGYHFGNRVLQQYARCVYEATGNTGHSYRIDGTKFAVISNTLSVDELREKYQRFRTFLHEGFEVDGRKILLNLHCGALQVDSFDIDSQTVYSCLNFAYEESKVRRGGELVVFHNDPNEKNQQRLEKLHAIRESITHGFDGFYLLYQPVVDAKTERMRGAEALLRWKNDRYGMVPPDNFIPVLEQDPLFPELGEWILREAILTAKQMLAVEPGFVMNVNLSYSQLEKPDFTDMVLRILNELAYPAENLCLEVTERCRLMDLELLKNVVANLKSRGILVALDDFGTGFSSVGLLREMPFDTIKVDRGFVARIEENETDRQIISSIADLASVFGVKVCVEGIETAKMRDALKGFRVESFQGYFYAKPMQAEELMMWGKHP